VGLIEETELAIKTARKRDVNWPLAWRLVRMFCKLNSGKHRFTPEFIRLLARADDKSVDQRWWWDQLMNPVAGSCAGLLENFLQCELVTVGDRVSHVWIWFDYELITTKERTLAAKYTEKMRAEFTAYVDSLDDGLDNHAEAQAAFTAGFIAGLDAAAEQADLPPTFPIQGMIMKQMQDIPKAPGT
jgi:hypothetical protein